MTAEIIPINRDCTDAWAPPFSVGGRGTWSRDGSYFVTEPRGWVVDVYDCRTRRKVGSHPLPPELRPSAYWCDEKAFAIEAREDRVCDALQALGLRRAETLLPAQCATVDLAARRRDVTTTEPTARELAHAWCATSRARRAAELATQLRAIESRLRADVSGAGRMRSPAVARKSAALGEQLVATQLAALRTLVAPKPPRRRRKRAGQLELPVQEAKP